MGYLPSLREFPEIRTHHTVGGAELLVHVIDRAGDLADETYVNFSDLARPEASDAAERAGKALRQIGESRLVPFTIPQAFRYPKYIERLEQERGLIRKPGNEYEWWHYVRTYRFENRK